MWMEDAHKTYLISNLLYNFTIDDSPKHFNMYLPTQGYWEHILIYSNGLGE